MTKPLLCRLGMHKDEASHEVCEDGKLWIFMECQRCGGRSNGYLSTFRPKNYQALEKKVEELENEIYDMEMAQYGDYL